MGIDRKNWPDLNNPSWGAEPFWEKPTPPTDSTTTPGKGTDADRKPGSPPETKPDLK